MHDVFTALAFCGRAAGHMPVHNSYLVELEITGCSLWDHCQVGAGRARYVTGS